MKKIVSLLLVLAFFAVGLISCNKKPEPPVGGSNQPTGTSEQPGGDQPEKTYQDLNKTDLGGAEFNILTRDAGSTVLWKPIDWTSNGEDRDDIPQAVFRRNQQVEQDFNCRITQKEADNVELLATAMMAYVAQTGDYDVIVMPVIQQISSMAVSGYYKDFATLNNLEIDDPWWNQKTNESLSLFGRYYTLCGDINIVDDLATWCVLFNKFIVNDRGLGDPYAAVENGEWTLELMYQNAASVAAEEHDRYGSGMYGIATEFGAVDAFFAAAGMVSVKLEDDVLVNNTKSYLFEGVFSKVYNYMKDERVQVMGDNVTDGSKGYPAVSWGVLYNIFVGDQALYLTGTLSNLISAQISNMTSPFGVLPIPKYSAEQTEYISTFQAGNATGASVLSNQSNAEDVAVLLTGMSAASVNTLTPAFYQTTLYGRKVPDPESVPMMDIILNNRAVDIGVVVSEPVRTLMLETLHNRASYTFVDVRTKYAQKVEDGLADITKAVKNNFQTEPN